MENSSLIIKIRRVDKKNLDRSTKANFHVIKHVTLKYNNNIAQFFVTYFETIKSIKLLYKF